VGVGFYRNMMEVGVKVEESVWDWQWELEDWGGNGIDRCGMRMGTEKTAARMGQNW